MVCSVDWWNINSTASVIHLCLQEGLTAILIAALYGHLPVLRTLVERYGGNLLHREKVKCYMMSNLWWVIRSWQYKNLCCGYFIVHFFPSCMFRYIVHDMFQVCLCAWNLQMWSLFITDTTATQLALYREVSLEKCPCILCSFIHVSAGFEYWILSCGYVLVVYVRMWCV